MLHYAARSKNEQAGKEIFEDACLSRADKFGRDAIGNNAEYYYDHDFPTHMDKTHLNNIADGGDDNSPTLDNAIKTKDFDKLVKYVLDGDTNKLMDRSSEDEEVQEFIDNVPALEVKRSDSRFF